MKASQGVTPPPLPLPYHNEYDERILYGSVLKYAEKKNKGVT